MLGPTDALCDGVNGRKSIQGSHIIHAAHWLGNDTKLDMVRQQGPLKTKSSILSIMWAAVPSCAPLLS